MKKRTLDMMIGIFLSIFLVLVVICLVKFGREKLGKKDPVLETQDTYQTDTEIYEDEINSEIFGTEIWDTEVTDTEVEGTELSEEEIAILESEVEESEEKSSEEKNSEEKGSEEKDSEKKESEEKESEKKEETKKPNYKYYIKVNRKANCVTVYTYDDEGKYTVPVKAMVCSVGRNNATPTGVFRTQGKYTWRTLYGNVYGQYSTRINGNVLFHSVPYRKTQKDTLITRYYNQLGTAASAGCVRLTCADAKWIYDNCALGTTVEIYDGSSAGPLGKPSAMKIDTNHPCAGWDPTDPDKNNPWRKQGPIITGIKDYTIERGESIDLIANVSATDSYGNSVIVGATGTVDTKVCGTYTITYSATDSNGKTTTGKSVVTVKDTKAPAISQTSDITVNNKTTEIEKLIKSSLQVTDAGETLDASVITLDISNLKKAMSSKSYGTIKVNATAKDASGNSSKVFEVKVIYSQLDESAPTITLTGTSVATSVDLTNITDEKTRKVRIEQVAKNAVKQGTHYTVKDDVSKENNIECMLSCNYTGETTKGNYKVKVTITAKDEVGQVTTKTIEVAVVVVDNTKVDNTENDNTEDNTQTTQKPGDTSSEEQGTQTTEKPGDTSSEEQETQTTEKPEDTSSEEKDTQTSQAPEDTSSEDKNTQEQNPQGIEDTSSQMESTEVLQNINEDTQNTEDSQNEQTMEESESISKNIYTITNIQYVSKNSLCEEQKVA